MGVEMSKKEREEKKQKNKGLPLNKMNVKESWI